MSIPPATSTLADRFAEIIDLLCRIIPKLIARDRTAGPLIILIHNHLRRMAVRFAAIAARAQAGISRTPRRGTARRTASPRAVRLLPCGYSWLTRVYQEAAVGGGRLQYMVLNDPEMAALLASSPQAGRIVRSLFWMLGVRPIPVIARRAMAPRAPRAVRVRVRAASKAAVAPPMGTPSPSRGSTSYRPSARWPKAHWPRPPDAKPLPVSRKRRATGPPWPD